MDKSSYSKIGDSVSSLIEVSIVVMFVSVPLAIWKIIDILIWVASKVKITVG